MIEIRHSSGHHIGYDHLTFSGGEEHVRLKPVPKAPTSISIDAHLRTSADFMRLAMIADAVDRAYGVPKYLRCPYVPYARQDRVCNPGEALGAKVICSMINAMGFAGVEIWDAHSDVVPAVLDRCVNIAPKRFVANIADIGPETVFVSPDAGAIKRVMGAAAKHGNEIVFAEKVRDTKTGNIVNTTVHSGHVGNRDFLIVDDICDGGRTFVELAAKLHPLTNGRILLYVTHGIFSKGLDVFRGVLDHVYTPNSWLPHDPSILTIIHPGESQ